MEMPFRLLYMKEMPIWIPKFASIGFLIDSSIGKHRWIGSSELEALISIIDWSRETKKEEC